MLAACVYLIETALAGAPAGIVINTLPDDERLRLYLFSRVMARWIGSKTWN